MLEFVPGRRNSHLKTIRRNLSAEFETETVWLETAHLRNVVGAADSVSSFSRGTK